MLDSCIVFKMNITEFLESGGDAVSEVLAVISSDKKATSRKLFYSVQCKECIFENLRFTPEEKYALAKNAAEYSDYFVTKTRYGHAIFISKFINLMGIGILMMPSEDTSIALKRIYNSECFIPQRKLSDYALPYSASAVRLLQLIERAIMAGTPRGTDHLEKFSAIDSIYAYGEIFGINIRFDKLFIYDRLKVSPVLYSLFGLIFSIFACKVSIGSLLTLSPIKDGKLCDDRMIFSVRIPAAKDAKVNDASFIFKVPPICEYISNYRFKPSEDGDFFEFSVIPLLLKDDPSAIGLKNPDNFKNFYEFSDFFDFN